MNARHRWTRRILTASFVIAATAAYAPAQRRAAECADCHVEQATQFEASVHQTQFRCAQCHGGKDVYELTPQQWRDYELGRPTSQRAATQRAAFDHGSSFRGKPARRDVPELCGTCHADVERMNPFGLRTDQLSRYRVSGHGKRLFGTGDDAVAVCIDCHAPHAVYRSDDPRSGTYFQRIPETCGRCHSDSTLMTKYNHPPSIVAQYETSVHGRSVLERGDAGAPTCATCHGSHGAAPPGFAQVGFVCGRCHQQTEEYFSQSVHGSIPVFPRCIACHSGDGALTNHHIVHAIPTPDKLRDLYMQVERKRGASDVAALRAGFGEALAQLGLAPRMGDVCRRCHGGEHQTPHGEFFKPSDAVALERGDRLVKTLEDAEFAYAHVAERVERLGRGVMLVREEALVVDEAKTDLLALTAVMHTLDCDKIEKQAEQLRAKCAQVHASLDVKQAALVNRRRVLSIVWGVLAVFVVLMYGKYLSLKYAWVRTSGPGAVPPPPQKGLPLYSRRRVLDVALSLLGTAGVAGVVWPAVAYILPARKRGGGSERVNAGGQADWAVWEERKIALHGKAVAVIRTDKEFRAFSLVCTHLGCIVHWESRQHEFRCPCHAGQFDMNGVVLSGPPPKPLPEYAVSVVQGDVIVSDKLKS